MNCANAAAGCTHPQESHDRVGCLWCGCSTVFPPYVSKCSHTFDVMNGSSEQAEFERCYARIGNSEAAKAHPTYCSQCLYSLAAEYFYHGFHAGKAKP